MANPLTSVVAVVDAVDLTIPFVCAACGYRGVARVIASARGRASHPAATPDPAARDLAEEIAVHGARERAERFLRRTPCPSCGRRSRAGRRLLGLHVAAIAAVLSFVGGPGILISIAF